MSDSIYGTSGISANYFGSSDYSYAQGSSALDAQTLQYLTQNDITINPQGTTSSLEFEDYMLLMIKQLQSQTMDNAMDTTDMLNQLVQMSSVQMMGALQETMQAMALSTNMTYAASLVGKEVTVGAADENGNLKEIVGTVTATGTYQGINVIFLGEDMYALNDIMAVGRLPEAQPEAPEGDSEAGEDTNTDNSLDEVTT